jgi:hypothetical protein
MITKLIAELRAAKMAEETAKKNRLDVENKILALYATPDGGEGTHNDEEFSIAWKLTRTVDAEALSAVFEMLGANVQKAFRWKPEIDLRQLRALQELDAPAYAEAAKYFTSKPAKPSVTLKD